VKKVLVIAPHMDDEVLGLGGTIARHVDNGDDVHVLFIAHRIYDHKFDKKKNDIEKSHAEQARKALGYKNAFFLDLNDERLDGSVQDIIIPVEEYLMGFKPDYVYCPFRQDNHQDHRAVYEAVRVVTRSFSTPFINKILMYEVPSSTEQSPPLPENNFLPNYYVDITKYFDKKMASYRCYGTEKRKFPHPRSERALGVLSQKRGVEVGFERAEAFMVLRDKW